MLRSESLDDEIKVKSNKKLTHLLFSGYHDDVIPGIILELSQLEECQDEKVLEQKCKESLLQCATPDGVMRLTDTQLKEQAEDIFHTYFINQTHDSLPHYIQALPEDDSWSQHTPDC